MKIAIVNYGMGNLGSVRRAIEDIGAEVFIANSPAALGDADKVVLPGVGSFAEGMHRLSEAGWIAELNRVIQQRKPLLGICLGMQMLASSGNEGGVSNGLGFVPGRVQRLDTLGCTLRIPHVGWNEVVYESNDPIFNGVPDSSDFYFVHSYAFIPDNDGHLIATVPYECKVAAVVKNENVFGCQFHPEKSSYVGRKLLKNFLDYRSC